MNGYLRGDRLSVGNGAAGDAEVARRRAHGDRRGPRRGGGDGRPVHFGGTGGGGGRVLAAADGRLDGAVLAAGVGPTPGAGRSRIIFEVNYFGVVDLLQAWRPALARGGSGERSAKVVVVSSNSTTTIPLVPRRAVRALLAGDADRAVGAMRLFGTNAPSMAYGASKIAVSRWVRRQAVTPQWARAGIRLNALAPGAILTPLLEKQLATPRKPRRSGPSRCPSAASGRRSNSPTGCCSCSRMRRNFSAAA